MGVWGVLDEGPVVRGVGGDGGAAVGVGGAAGGGLAEAEARAGAGRVDAAVEASQDEGVEGVAVGLWEGVVQEAEGAGGVEGGDIAAGGVAAGVVGGEVEAVGVEDGVGVGKEAGVELVGKEAGAEVEDAEVEVACAEGEREGGSDRPRSCLRSVSFCSGSKRIKHTA